MAGTTESAPTCKSRWFFFANSLRTTTSLVCSLPRMAQCVRGTSSTISHRRYVKPLTPSLFAKLVPNSRSDPAVSKTASGSAVTQINTTTPSSLKAPSNGSAQPSPIGLYTLRAIDPLSHDALEELKTMEENCLHNSQVCMEIGASGKGAVRPGSYSCRFNVHSLNSP